MSNNGSKWCRRTRRMAIYARDGWRCVWCNRPGTLTLDHVVALDHGGTHESSNLVSACLPCNSSRQNATTPQWRERLLARNIDARAAFARARKALRKSVDMALGAAIVIALGGDVVEADEEKAA